MGIIHGAENNAVLYSIHMTRGREILASYINLDGKDDGVISQLLFFVPLGVWIAARILLSLSAFPSLVGTAITYSNTRLLCLGCLAVRELLFGKWDRLTLLGLFLFGWMAEMTYLANYNAAFDTIIFIFAGRNIRFERLIRFMLPALTLCVFLVIFAALIGLIPDTVVDRKASMIARHQLGFSHANTGPGIFLFIACSWIYIRDEKYGVIDASAIVCISAVLFVFTNSRAACACSATVAALALCVKWLPRRLLRSRLLSTLGVGSVVICAIVSISLAAFYDPSIEWMNVLNKIMSGRLSLGHNAILNHGFPLIGQEVDSGLMKSYDRVTGAWKSAGRVTTTIIDCEYVRFLITCGWPFMLIALTMCTLVCARARREEQWALLVIIAIIAIHGTVENYGSFAYFNPFIFLLGELFSDKNSKIPAAFHEAEMEFNQNAASDK